jgi:lysophosphatidate acyltransferase
MHALLLYPLYFLAAYVATVLALFTLYTTLSNPPLLVGFIARCMSGYLSLMVSAAYGTIASLILRCLDLHYKYGQWTTAKSFKWICRYTVGVKFDIMDNGREKLDAKRPYVIVVNHQSELDILLLGWIWPKHCSVTAKKSLKIVPILGWFMTASGSVFIDRANRDQAVKAFAGAAKTMQDLGQSVLIFPEGTRSYSTEPMLLPFKKGAFHLAVQAGADILPVVAENYSQVLNVKAKRFNAGTIRVKGECSMCTRTLLWLTLFLVLDPIPTKGLTASDVNKLSEDTRSKMLQVLNQMAEDKESKSVKAHAS